MKGGRMKKLLRFLVFIVGSMLIFSMVSFAAQFDAPYYDLHEKNKDKWAAEDQQINTKLAALEKKFGKKPNIIFILTDDIGWGEPGWQYGGKRRGTPTPELDQLASESMAFSSHYTEPSCTPTRIALMTGRHPVRTGVTDVLWPGGTAGLPAQERTIAELLSDAGYSTAMWGKWHLGDLDEHAPENQGFDYAYYTLYNAAFWMWSDVEKHYQADDVVGHADNYDFPGNEEYEKRYGIKIHGIMKGEKGKERQEVARVTRTSQMVDHEAEMVRQIKAYIKTQAKSDKPFFIYWASNANSPAGSPQDVRFGKQVDSRNNNGIEMVKHSADVAEVVETLKDEGIEENTLLVWMSDNGPMYAFFPNSGYSWLRGGKGDVLEGGVRTPAFARWPGMIEPGQDPLDMIHVTDMFTTAARIGGVLDRIPDDRVTDGIDQTAFLLNGEGYSRRNYMVHYSGPRIGALRLGDYKAVMGSGGGGGLPTFETYNVVRDPGEKYGKMYPYLWFIQPVTDLMQTHMQMIQKYPHNTYKQ
jgi:arylsulfatase